MRRVKACPLRGSALTGREAMVISCNAAGAHGASPHSAVATLRGHSSRGTAENCSNDGTACADSRGRAQAGGVASCPFPLCIKLDGAALAAK